MDRVVAERSGEEIATQLATQQSNWAKECTTLMIQLEAAPKGKSMVETQLVGVTKEKCVVDAQLA